MGWYGVTNDTNSKLQISNWILLNLSVMSGIHWVPLTTSSVTTKTRLQRAFFSQKTTRVLIDINVTSSFPLTSTALITNRFL